MAVDFIIVWGKEAKEEREQVRILWQTNGVLTDEARVNERLRQVALVARKGQEVIGVATVNPVQVKLLNNHYFLEFRCFIAPRHRAPGLDTALVLKTKELFSHNGHLLPYPCKGMLMLIDNPALKKHWTRAVWPGTNMVFVGYTPEGHHIRVSYFKDARI